MEKITLKKIATCALFSALATISFTLENLLPPIILPGARLGVANVFILLALISLGVSYGFIALIIKITLGSLFSGNISSIMYSLPAGIISLSLEVVLLKAVENLSVVSISVAGAVVNSTVQNLIFCLVTGAVEYLYYLPYLALIAVLAGLLVGFTVYLAIKRIPKNLIL
ncbi:MAG: Gx transporter family protein [Clostridia bacterium]|nr:Gx transporter family protein [Clostridia bacterium]